MNRVQEHLAEEASQEPLMARCNAAAEAAIKDYPLAMTMAVFGAGLGLGVLIGEALASPMGLRPEPTAEKLGRKILDSIAEYLPASVQKQIYG